MVERQDKNDSENKNSCTSRNFYYIALYLSSSSIPSDLATTTAVAESPTTFKDVTNISTGLFIAKINEYASNAASLLYPIPVNTVNSIITDVKSDDSVISVETGYTSYVVYGRYKEDIDWNGLEYEALENIKDENLSLISLYYPESDIEEVEKICRFINEKYSDEVVAYRNTYFIDVVPKGCSKGEGVNYVKERESIDTKDTYAIGDSYNDIPMFKEAGNSFTFETSEDGVKKEVKYIVNSVAEAIKNYCLK